jgi:hypothetical protein
LWLLELPVTFTSTTLVQIPNGKLVSPAVGNPGTWAQQGTNAITVYLDVLGTLDEPSPANDNDLIERMSA